MNYREYLKSRYAGKSEVYTAFATGSRSANDKMLNAIIAAVYSDAPDAVKLARIRTTIDAARLRREHPDLYTQYAKTTTSRVFRQKRTTTQDKED